MNCGPPPPRARSTASAAVAVTVQHVVAVDGRRRAVRAPAARSAICARGDLLPRRELAVQVVLADEDDRQLVDLARSSGTRGSSPGWWRRRRRRRPRRRRGAGAPAPRRWRRRCCRRRSRSSRSSRCSRSITFIEPARPPQTPVARPEQLVEQRLRARRRARARGRGRGRCRRRGPRRPSASQTPTADGLLARAQVRRAVHLAPLEQRLDLVLEAADEAHAPVELEVVRGVLGARPGAADRGPLLAHEVCIRASESASSRRRGRRPCRSRAAPRRGTCVRMSVPSAVTTTSSSMRAAERPSVAAQ